MEFDIVELFTNSLVYELNKHNLTTKDIKWIGSKNGKYYCLQNDFIKRIELLKLNQLEYDYSSLSSFLTNLNSYNSLVVVGENWWLHLIESSKSETNYYWNYLEFPILQTDSNPFHYLPGTITVSPFTENSIDIEVKRFTNSNTLRKLLNVLEINDYLDPKFPFDVCNITLKEIEKIKNGVSLDE